MARIFVIDDDEDVCKTLRIFLGSMGHEVSSAFSLEEGLRGVSQSEFDMVFLDVNLPDGSGLEAIRQIKRAPLSPEVIIITGEGSANGAEMAVRSGAWDYIQKPLTLEEIRLPLIRVLQYRSEKAKAKPPLLLKRERIVGSSPEIARCLDDVAKTSAIDANVLIRGETGTGKELFARAIHENSTRAGKTFVVLDCAALPETLIESLLFGHDKGAYTGADKIREGLLKEADGGTLFLDEVGELPMSVQASFLRVLQERRFRPLGGKEEIRSDFRLITATNRDLEEMVGAGSFRRDLFFRLNAVTIDLPPLRERTKDIKDLALHYLKVFCDRYGMGIKGFSPEFLEALNAYPWPGNVREVMNAIESSLTMARDEPTLYPIHLPVNIRTQLIKASVSVGHSTEDGSVEQTKALKSFSDLRTFLEKEEEKYFRALISHTRGDIKEICRISGLSRANVYVRLKKYGLSRST